MRFYGAILLLLGLGLLAGCPHPKEGGATDIEAGPASESSGGNPAKRLGRKTDTDKVADGEQSESDAQAGGEATADESAKAADEVGESEALKAGTPDKAGLPSEASDEVTFPNRNKNQGPEPAEDSSGVAQDVLDPGAMLGEAAEGPAEMREPPAPLDRAARAFSGDWSVIVVNQAGRSRMAESDDEWLLALADDSNCTVSRNLNGSNSEQSGRWELQDGVLTLRLGPAHRSYHVKQPRDNVALLADAATGAVLFCLRLTPGERAPMLRQSYELGGSELTFRSAGPGGYWRGTLTEPECSLLVRPVGNFVAGTWETPQDDGYVLLELTDDGFDGWWWYSDSTEFDGVWRSGAE